jgi:hypothetical protein
MLVDSRPTLSETDVWRPLGRDSIKSCKFEPGKGMKKI